MAQVLIVDDSVTIRLTIELILKREHETITAVNGQDALEILDQRDIDLIVTDIQMPVMNGYELLQRIREDERYHKHPVIMLSQSINPADPSLAVKYGANHFLSKPVRSNELLEVVRDIVKENGASAKTTPPLTVIDRSMLLPMVNNNVAQLDDFLAEVLPLFNQEASQMIVSLKQAVVVENMETISQISHNLKGSSGYLGASRLVQLSLEMETAAHEGVTDDMFAKLTEIQTEVARIRAYTNAHFPQSTSPF
jgi:CheY-like chemotaxis protein/HPt (histidine-containing phosphotransfer) domain-containing protein